MVREEPGANLGRNQGRFAILSERTGSGAWRTITYLVDPVLLRTVGDGMLLAGIELCVEGPEVRECGQVWLCRPAPLTGEPLPPLDLKDALASFQPDGG